MMKKNIVRFGMIALLLLGIAGVAGPAANAAEQATSVSAAAGPSGCQYTNVGWGVVGVQGWGEINWCYDSGEVTDAQINCFVRSFGGTGVCTYNGTDPAVVWQAKSFIWTVQWTLCATDGSGCTPHHARVLIDGNGGARVLSQA